MNVINTSRKIAVLIDGDNASGRSLALYLAEASKYGQVTTKRVYGDWTSPHMNKWKDSLNKTAIRPIQKFEYTKSKNSTDTMLIIDAMDLLHLGPVDGFCIVSSDSDYTGLVHRIREHGKFVMGIGQKFTPEAFVNACEVFAYAEDLEFESQQALNLQIKSAPTKENGCSNGCNSSGNNDSSIINGKRKQSPVTPPQRHSPRQRLVVVDKPCPPLATRRAAKIEEDDTARNDTIQMIDWDTIHQVYTMTEDTSGEASLRNLANNFRKLDPSFNHRVFGFTTFRKFCEALAPTYMLVEGSNQSLALCKAMDQSLKKVRSI